MKIIPTLLFLLLLLSFLSGCQQKDKAARQPEMTVRVAQAVLLKEQTPKEFSFIAKPFRTSELSFRVGGPISNFEVYAGNYYRKGEVIATIDDRDFLIRKEQTQAVYDIPNTHPYVWVQRSGVTSFSVMPRPVTVNFPKSVRKSFP